VVAVNAAYDLVLGMVFILNAKVKQVFSQNLSIY